jgi:CHAT domain-containing protein
MIRLLVSGWIIILLCSGLNAQQLPLDKLATLKQQDNITEYIYTHIDAYLANASPDHLPWLDACESDLWRPLQTEEEHLALVMLLCHRGYGQLQAGAVHLAAEAYEKAWIRFDSRKLTGVDIIEYCLKPLGNIYSMLGDYEHAVNIITQYLYMAERDHNPMHRHAAFVNLAIVFMNTGRYSEAEVLLGKALALNGIEPEKKIQVYINLAQLSIRANELKKAETYVSVATKMLYALPMTTRVGTQVVLFRLWGRIHSLQLRYSQALHHYEQANTLVRSYSISESNRDAARQVTEHATILKQLKRYNNALAMYRHALSILVPGYSAETPLHLPSSNELYPETILKEAFDGVADVYTQLRKTDRALQWYALSFKVDEMLYDLYQHEYSRLQLRLEIRQRTLQALTLLHKQYTLTKNEVYALQAFELAEKTRAVAFLEIMDNQQQSITIERDSIYRRKKDLQHSLAAINTARALERIKENPNVTYLNHLTARQTTLSIAYKEAERKTGLKYPATKTHPPLTGRLPELQQLLKNNKAILLEYVAGADAFYAFIITPTHIEFNKLNNIKQLQQAVTDLHGLFSEADNINNDISRYKTLAHELYALLQIPNVKEAEQLLVVPDGILSLLPFDVLLTEPANGTHYETFPYLLHRYGVAYTPSATVYLYQPHSSWKEWNTTLGMFPIFKQSDLHLRYSQQEAESIQDQLPGSYIYSEQATKHHFVHEAPRYPIIHLSTHASAGTMQEPASIMFIDSTLYLPEIYGMQLHSDLMVLSACETGMGTVVKGEGAISLARSFQLAGVSNIIFSLWRVNDRATADIMASFYQSYSTSGSKTNALRQAKVDYLKSPDIRNAQKSPYYWAGFVYYGTLHVNPTPLFSKSKKLMIVGCLIVLIAGILMYRARKQQFRN